MKRVLTLTLAACILAALAIGCNSAGNGGETKLPETGGAETVSEATEKVENADESSAVDEVSTTEMYEVGAGGIGGTGKELYYAGKYRFDFYGIPRGLYTILGENGSEVAYEWLNEEYNYNNTKGNWKKPFSVLDFIKKFNIIKEDFISVNETLNRYTDEEVDALFSDDIQLIYEAFVSPNAFYINGNVYTPEMIHGLTLDEIKEIGITESDISAKMTNWGYDLAYTQFYSDMIELCKANNIEYEVFEWSDNAPSTETAYATWLPETEEVYFTTELPTQTEQPTEAASASE